MASRCPVSHGGDNRSGFSEAEAKHGAARPTSVYPLFENAIRNHLGLDIDKHQQRLGKLYSRFTKVAAENPYAVVPAVSHARRDNKRLSVQSMGGLSVPEVMNAIMEVDQAAAVIMTGSRDRERAWYP